MLHPFDRAIRATRKAGATTERAPSRLQEAQPAGSALVITDFTNLAMPFIWYANGEVVVVER